MGPKAIVRTYSSLPSSYRPDWQGPESRRPASDLENNPPRERTLSPSPPARFLPPIMIGGFLCVTRSNDIGRADNCGCPLVGGTPSYGITGLFLGPIALAVMWELAAEWVYARKAAPSEK
jgi:hypothetical protein